MNEPTTTESTQPDPPARTRLRAAIDRAIARRAALELYESPAAEGEPSAAATSPVSEPSASAPPAPLLAAPPRSLRQDRYRVAADRAANRERAGSAPIASINREPVEAASFGRMRNRVRPRHREQKGLASAQSAVQAPASEFPLAAEAIAQPSPRPAASESAGFPETARRKRGETAASAAPPRPAATPAPQEAAAPPELRRPPLALALLAGSGWTALLVWLIVGRLTPETGAATRMAFGGALVALGLLTWAPIQWATRLPMLTWRGTVGLGIVLWTLAFVPPPTQRIVAGLPDLPVYLLFFCGAFLASNAIALPFTYVRGIRRYHNRAERFDHGRARRQAAEVGLFSTLCLVLAAMNVLEPVTVLLLIAILILSEMVILSLKR